MLHILHYRWLDKVFIICFDKLLFLRFGTYLFVDATHKGTERVRKAKKGRQIFKELFVEYNLNIFGTKNITIYNIERVLFENKAHKYFSNGWCIFEFKLLAFNITFIVL